MKGSSSHFCLLIEKPQNCPQESFEQLHEVFMGDLCEDQDFPILGPDSLPPAYLTVPQFRDCMGKKQKDILNQSKWLKDCSLFIYNIESVSTGSEMKGSSGHFCLLIEKPDGCPQESFDKLHEVFQGDLCDGYANYDDNYDDYHIYWPFYGPPNISPLSQNSIVDQFRIWDDCKNWI